MHPQTSPPPPTFSLIRTTPLQQSVTLTHEPHLLPDPHPLPIFPPPPQPLRPLPPRLDVLVLPSPPPPPHRTLLPLHPLLPPLILLRHLILLPPRILPHPPIRLPPHNAHLALPLTPLHVPRRPLIYRATLPLPPAALQEPHPQRGPRPAVQPEQDGPQIHQHACHPRHVHRRKPHLVDPLRPVSPHAVLPHALPQHAVLPRAVLPHVVPPPAAPPPALLSALRPAWCALADPPAPLLEKPPLEILVVGVVVVAGVCGPSKCDMPWVRRSMCTGLTPSNRIIPTRPG
mmetsp:Transcript_41708/g.67662  ORF Transcript_41708/g.67662 Transcript_41708/m.67662 type:complete len:287 (+) Transcript_41708:2432-3292(+)